MPELITSKEQQLNERTPKANIGYGMAPMPDAAFDIPASPELTEPETFLHPVKAFNDLVHAIQENTAKTDLLLKQSLKERVFNDSWQMVGATVGYRVNFHERKYVYAYALAALTLNYSNGGSVPIAANQWTNVSPPRDTMVTVSGGSDVNPTAILFRACDVPMASAMAVTSIPAISGTVTANAGTNLNTSLLALEAGNLATIKNILNSLNFSSTISALITAQATNNASVPTGAGNTVIKGAPGAITSIVVTTAGTGAGNVIIFDNATTNAGTPLAVLPATVSVGTQFQVNGWAKAGMTAQNVLNGPVFTVYFS